MGMYFQQDIEVDDGGELQFDNGDLKIASVKRTHLQALHWAIACNRDDSLVPDATANLGIWFGSLNIARNHRAMEDQIKRAIAIQEVFFVSDVAIRVVPVSETEAAVTAHLLGIFDEPSAELEDVGYANLGYVFPFSTGVLKKVV